MTVRKLIVNADDFGQSASINAGVIRAHEQGIVTSASMMVRWPDSAAAGEYAQAHRDLSVGLHFDLGEWEFRDSEWHELYHVASPSDEAAVADELERQLSKFVELVGQPPTHLDSHQHVHRDPVCARLLVAAGRQLGVPVRDQNDLVTYSGSFYGQTGDGFPLHQYISVAALKETIRTLGPGWTELGCHPGTADDVPGMYSAERVVELATLCDPSVREHLSHEHVELATFAQLV